jgi:deoxyribonuclease V
MKALALHAWNVTPAQARQIQLELRARREPGDRLPRLRWVAGADVAFDLRRDAPKGSWWGPARHHGRAIAGVVVYSFPELVEVERATAEVPLTFPYIPGLLSFREIPALVAAFERLRHKPDLIFCDGHGYAHPRRFGIACHVGVLLDRPTVGCAKSRLIGAHTQPARHAGSWTPLVDRREDGEETLGAVLRTRDAVKPIYVSTGHRISLERAIELVLAVCDGYRIPRPTREADHFVEAVKRGDWPPRSRSRAFTRRGRA